MDAPIPPSLGAVGAPTVKDYLDPLNAFLLQSHADGRNNVLVIDEQDGGLASRVEAVGVRAVDKRLGRTVAVKELLRRGEHGDSNEARFLREALITARLEHPGIVPVYSLGSYADGRPFYAMRFVRGDSLEEAKASIGGRRQRGGLWKGFVRRLRGGGPG